MEGARNNQRDSRPLDAFLEAIGDDEEASQRIRRSILKAGQVIADRYTLRDRIARGGMATIWEADDAVRSEVVAIKFIGQAYADDPEFRTRFAAEATSASRLRSPYVVRIYD